MALAVEVEVAGSGAPVEVVGSTGPVPVVSIVVFEVPLLAVSAVVSGQGRIMPSTSPVRSKVAS